MNIHCSLLHRFHKLISIPSSEFKMWISSAPDNIGMSEDKVVPLSPSSLDKTIDFHNSFLHKMYKLDISIPLCR